MEPDESLDWFEWFAAGDEF